MKKTISYIIGSSLVLNVIPLAGFAAFHEAIKDRRTTAKEEAGEKREQFKQDVQQKRETLKKEVQETKDTIKKELKEKRDILTNTAKEKRDELREEAKRKRELLRKEIQAKREEFKEGTEARKIELKKKLGERRAGKIEGYFNKMAEKFDQAIDRLLGTARRIEERLEKAEANGKDVASLRADLIAAEGKILEARKTLEAAKTRYDEAVKNPDFKASFQKVKEVVDEVAKKVREARQALVGVINSIKGLGGGGRMPIATTTPTTSTPAVSQ